MQRTNPAPSEFTADIISRLTTYGLLATPDETDAMLRRAYGPDRIPGTESRRRSQMGEAKTCGMPGCDQPARSCGWCYTHCEATHRHEPAVCSVEGCPPKRIPTAAEVEAEMREALDRLREDVTE